ncbi:ATP phosphoribosyltransferase regulatory subunit [Sphingomonas guangdongensis]|uniref:ATP phosphoribosyltransferase regulatory subunit n=1 Tax=Sphingomonas guangdongensis TaxID=1141890 RepID=A0A285QDD9_9SPHN|nr:ATP phosphoribosyltransferase regulatory subunit [Sphingomonas guangdongensis]SOB79548.1 ATP phosphoribosyltransferase regulatory subunit [Sphingomonas guangdongensis]
MTGLLPEGFHDRLPPFADQAARLERSVLDTARAYGYEQVDPPLAEFEDALARRLKAGAAQGAVRFVDPVSQRTLAIRPDITAQVGRIAATRMGHHPRPVRLSYAGPVLKLRASELKPERALRQIGVELIGLDSVAAAREVVLVAVEALTEAGVTGLSVDLTLPDLVATMGGSTALAEALDAKDAAAVAAIDRSFLPLIAAAGPFTAAVAKLRSHAALASRLDGLEQIAAALPPGVSLTLDPTERHGFEYQNWFGFSLFAAGASDQIGRGGTYGVIHDDGREEPAVGVTLYVDPILGATAGAVERRRLFLPHGTDPADGARLRREGWVTVAALEAHDTPEAQLCSHILFKGEVQPA